MERQECYSVPKQSMPLSQARSIAAKLADEMGYELVDVELVKEPTGKILRFYVEKGEGFSLNELEAYHRKIQSLVENVDFDYMEVSSPGADRPLKTERDFERAEGMEVELHTYRPVNGAKQFRGGLIGLREDGIHLMCGEEELIFPKKEVSIVRPYIDFDEDELQDELPQGD